MELVDAIAVLKVALGDWPVRRRRAAKGQTKFRRRCAAAVAADPRKDPDPETTQLRWTGTGSPSARTT